jgi:hypothetical protein
MKSWKVFGSAAAVSALCASAILWSFPADTQQPSEPTVSAPDSSTPLTGSAPQAVPAATALSRAFPNGGTPDTTVKGWPFPCATSHAPLASASRTRKSGNGGLLAAARIYTAGYGSIALQDLHNAATECGATTSTVNIGDDGFIAYDRGSSKTGTTPGRTVAFRVGDAIGFITVRSSTQNPSSLARQWAKPWPTILQNSGCKSTNTSTQAHLRNPLNPSYEGKLRPRTVSLNTTTLRTIEQNVTAHPTKLWKKPRPDRTKKSLPSYPDSLRVALPAAPANPTAPTWPSVPQTTTSINENVRDAAGPGCGWTFAGLTEPDFDAQQAQQSSDARAERTLTTLTNNWTEYTKQRKIYQRKYRAYQEAVNAYNTWVREATLRIAVTWWNSYDTQMQQHRDKVAAWEKAHAQWKQRVTECEAVNTDTDNNSNGDAAKITPTPTASSGNETKVTPTPCDPGNEPTLVSSPPSEPTLPRPYR